MKSALKISHPMKQNDDGGLLVTTVQGNGKRGNWFFNIIYYPKTGFRCNYNKSYLNAKKIWTPTRNMFPDEFDLAIRVFRAGIKECNMSIEKYSETVMENTDMYIENKYKEDKVARQESNKDRADDVGRGSFPAGSP